MGCIRPFLFCVRWCVCWVAAGVTLRLIRASADGWGVALRWGDYNRESVWVEGLPMHFSWAELYGIPIDHGLG